MGYHERGMNGLYAARTVRAIHPVEGCGLTPVAPIKKAAMTRAPGHAT